MADLSDWSDKPTAREIAEKSLQKLRQALPEKCDQPYVLVDSSALWSVVAYLEHFVFNRKSKPTREGGE